MAEAMAINQREAERMIAANTKAGAANLKAAADDVTGTAIREANLVKLRKVEHDFMVAKIAEEEALKKRIAETTAALAADAAHEEVLANGTAAEIIKKQNHDVYLAKLADLVANKTDTIANRTAIAAFEATANAHDLVNQETLHTGRLKDAQDRADTELRTYTEMTQHADQYTRGALQAQLEKYRELAFAATASGRASVDAQDAGAAATDRHTAALDKQKQKEDALAILAETRRIRDTGGLYTIDEAGNVRASGTSVTGATLEGKVSKVSDRSAGDPAYLTREIARLTRETAAYLAPPSRSYTNDPAGARAAEMLVQKQLDAVKQLAYLETLLGLVGGRAGTGDRGGGDAIPLRSGRGVTVNVAMHVNGIFDPSARHVLSSAVGDGLMRAVQNGRPG